MNYPPALIRPADYVEARQWLTGLTGQSVINWMSQQAEHTPAVGRTAFTTQMTPDTLAALVALAEALADAPQDIAALNTYGNLPHHLMDAIDDYHDDYNPLDLN